MNTTNPPSGDPVPPQGIASPDFPDALLPTQSVRSIVLSYVLLATLWILFSDQLLATVIADPDVRVRWSTYKGLAFVLVTGAMLYALINRLVARLQRYQLLADEARDIVLFLRKDGGIVDANRAAVAAYGYAREHLLSLTIHDLRVPETHPLTAAQLAQAAAEGILFETVHRRRDGSTFPVEVSSRGTTLGGELVLLSIIRDITGRKQAEAALARRNRHLEAIRAVSEEITHELDLTRLLHLLIARAADLVGASAATLYLWEPEHGLVVPAAWHGLGDWQAAIRHPLGQGIAGTVAQTRQGLCVNDYRTSRYANPVTLQHTRVTASLGEPLLYREELIGAITVSHEEGHCFTEDDQEIVRLFATQAAIAIENARLYQAVVRRGAELEALLRATRSIMSGLDLEGILDRILAEAAAMVGTAHVRVTLVDRAARVLRVARTTGSLVAPGTEYPLESLSGLVVTSGEPVFSPQVTTDPRAHFGSLYAEFGIVTYLGLPIKIRGEVIGVLIITTTASREYPPEELAYPTSFADYAAIAIENARLFQEEQQRREQLEAVRVVSAEIAHELDMDRLLDLILRRAIELAGAEAGVIMLWDEAEQALFPRLRIGEFWAKMPVRPIALGEGVVGRVAQTRQELIINDYRAWAGARQIALTQTAITAALGEPLLYRDRLIGVINLIHIAEKGTFNTHHGAFLRLFGDQAAIALENARLFQEQQRSFGALQRAQEELVRSEKLRGLGQMAAGIAHDLNNMLAAILGQVELLKLRGVPADVRDGLATLETAASDGAQVVRRLQDFARQRAASPLAPMDLAQAVHEALEITRPRWQDELQQRGKTIVVHAALAPLPPILGHAPEIREVLTNLIFNAVDAMPDGGRLTLAGAATPTEVTLTLTDTGVGMPEDVRQKIFEPFFTTKGVKGTGLGLAVVYSILERHGGRVAVASAPGQGTTVTLHFQAAVAGIAAPAAAPPLRSAPRRLLLIDDEPLVRTTLGSLLRAMGHTVTEAASGADGLATLATHPVDCVLTDLGMPEMTGWDVARAVRARHPILPIVLLTGWGEQAPGDVAEMSLVDRVLGKPVRLEDLLDTIAELTPDPPRPKP
ncbi:MAG: GAF domain-containing protein [candidate division NC10 bacterium]|nr:GAF domain-containing protein [candidate division NC10 bacterium]